MREFPTDAAPPVDANMREVQDWALRRALAHDGGSVRLAATRLGVAFKTVYNWRARRELAAPTAEGDRRVA